MNTARAACLVQALLCPLALAGQQSDQDLPPSAQQSNASGDERTETIFLPAPLGGFTVPLTKDEKKSPSPNLVTGSIGVQTVYTDNFSSAGTAALDDYQYSLVPSLGIQSFGEQTQWLLNYSGGVTVDQRLRGNTQQAHAATVDVRHKFSPRLTGEVRENYTMTSNPFTRIGSAPSLPTIAGPGQLSSFATPFPVTRIANISEADLSYRLTQHSAVGASGSFSLLHFRDVATSSGSLATLIDTTDTTGRAFYALRISPRQTIGAEYQLQDLKFGGGAARTVDHALFLFDGFTFTPNTTLSIYAGPEYTHTHNIIVLSAQQLGSVIPLLKDQWSLSGGVAYAWRTARNGVRVSGESGVSDANGWLGAARLNTASLELEKALSQRWIATLQLNYSDGRGIANPSSIKSRVTSEEGGLGFRYRPSRSLTATMDYRRIRQPHLGPFIQVIRPGYNEIQIGLTYQFQKAFSK
jgi:hypothetical protein